MVGKTIMRIPTTALNNGDFDDRGMSAKMLRTLVGEYGHSGNERYCLNCSSIIVNSQDSSFQFCVAIWLVL